MPGELQPLVDNQKIVTEDGLPTQYFIRWAQQRQIDISGGITTEQAQQLIDDWAAQRSVIAGSGLDGGGTLDSDVTLTLDLVVQQEGVTVASGVHTLNFTGTGVTVTETAAGIVEVNITGGTPPPVTPGIRGTGAAYYNASSVFVPWPAGTIAGDLVLVFNANGFFINNPSGWTVLYNGSSNVNRLGVFSKVMTGGDITAGGENFTASGSFDGTYAVVTFDGSGGAPSLAIFQAGTSGAGPMPVTTDGSPLTTDTAVYYGSIRSTSSLTVTCDQGTLAEQVSNTGASVGLYTGQPPAPGMLTANFSFTSGNDGAHGVIIIAS